MLLCVSIVFVLSFACVLLCRVPVRTFFEGLGPGCVAVALSHDAHYLATLTSKPTSQVMCACHPSAADEEAWHWPNRVLRIG